MKQLQQRYRWQRWIALGGLLSLLFFCAASASHIHGSAATGSVKQECQICLTGGLSRTLPSTPQVSGAVILTFFLLLRPQEQPRSVYSFHPGTPRSPPLS